MWQCQSYISAVQSQELAAETNGGSFISLSLSKYVDSPVRRIEIPARPSCILKNASRMHRRNGWILGNATAILTVFREWALRSVAVGSRYFGGMQTRRCPRKEQKLVLQKLIGYQLFCNEWNNYILYMFFWVFPQRQYVICRRFGTMYQFHLQRLEVHDL